MCVDDGQTEGGTFERVQIFILAQELKKLSFTLSGIERAVWCKPVYALTLPIQPST